MFKNIKDMFVHPTAEEIRARQLAEAERKLADIECDLEYTAAMRDMLKARVERLTKS